MADIGGAMYNLAPGHRQRSGGGVV